MNIAVLGAGNWGTTVSILLNGKGHSVRLWEYNENLAAEMLAHRENRIYLKGFYIPEKIYITSHIDDAVWQADMVVFVVPSSSMRQTAVTLKKTGAMNKKTLIVSLSKGLEHETMNTMTQIIEDEIDDCPVVALSGPCIANEVAHGLPTTIVAASENLEIAQVVQDIFMTPRFRVYTSDDPLGVQLGGALKNIIAIAAGITDGLGYGTNAKSALVTRGIVEIVRFGMELGAKSETFKGLSGIGDLITTCISTHSRNRHLGEELGRGKRVNSILKEMVMVAEGMPTTKSVCEFSRLHTIEMPITDKVYSVMFEDMPPDVAVNELMTRERKSE
ncbi:MAG: NAD(P)-dependent glycerol-3-phosphate dehydrogenase [Candidatus Latescibacteria bacterium]|nr:NAD(P)-dependent glycerol-3-phosphate dehydrogenase [Candidatus Latescibacterota bacterium]